MSMYRNTLFFSMLCATIPVATVAQDTGDTVGNTPGDAKTTTYNGRLRETLSSPTDVDFFRFSVRTDRDNPEHDTSGNLTVNFSQKAPPGTNPNSGWRVELYSENDLANSLYSAILPETRLEIEFEQGLSPNTYYYKVSSVDNQVFPAAEYTLNSTWKEDTHYEKPPNDTADTATAIKANENYYGNLSSASDVDFYRISLTAPDAAVTVRLTQDSPGADSTIGWQLSLLSPTLPEQEIVNIPLTKLSGTTPQLSLEAGVHYIYVKALPQTSEVSEDGKTADKSEEELAPIGKSYKIIVNAPTVPQPPTECEFIFTYAQHPGTHRWATFATPCEVPAGWYSTQTPPETSEVCPSPHASYTFPKTNDDGSVQPGVAKIPLLDYEDDTGKYIFRVELQQDNNNPILFQLGDVKVVRVVEDKTAVTE